jgi:hypothetical protein
MYLLPLAKRLCAAAALLSLAASAAGAACIPDNFPADYLQQQEAAGGHTIARHIGKTDEQLVQRLEQDRRIREASTYPAVASAQADIIAFLAGGRVAINSWAAGARNGATHVWEVGAGHVVGRVASRPLGLGDIAASSHLRVVLRKTGANACLLLTSFPIPDPTADE